MQRLLRVSRRRGSFYAEGTADLRLSGAGAAAFHPSRDVAGWAELAEPASGCDCGEAAELPARCAVTPSPSALAGATPLLRLWL